LLFVLSKDLLAFCHLGGGLELEALQNLLLSVRRGHHALTGPHEIFAALAKNVNLAQRERGVALSLANRRSELPLLEQQVKHKILVNAVTEPASPRRCRSSSWQIGVRELSSKFLNSMVILAENMIDAELYQHAGRHYQIFNRLNGVVIHAYPRGGGGSQIDVELRGMLTSGFPVLAITDGDGSFPNAPRSVVSSRCDELIAEERGIGWHFCLPVRDIENIVPLNVLLEVADPQNGPKAYGSLEQLSTLKNKLGSCPTEFACLKKGLSLSQAFKGENITEREYWIVVAMAIRHQRPQSFRNCVEQLSCDSSPCACTICYGFGEAVLVQVKKWLSERSSQESLRSFATNEIWMRVGAMVFDAGIAFKPEKI
jgi:hypothetical protein